MDNGNWTELACIAGLRHIFFIQYDRYAFIWSCRQLDWDCCVIRSYLGGVSVLCVFGCLLVLLCTMVIYYRHWQIGWLCDRGIVGLMGNL